MSISINISSHGISGCEKHSALLTCHAYTSANLQYKWISSSKTHNFSHNTASVEVAITTDLMEYQCIVTDGSGNSGNSSISIDHNGK